MRWARALLGLTGFIAACVSTPLLNIEAGSSVHFETRKGVCTAIHLGKGDVLTAAHCIVPFGMQIEQLPVTLQWISHEYDVALLSVPKLATAPFSVLACRAPILGELIVLIADTTWAKNIYSFGRVSSKSDVHLNGQDVVLLNITAAAGNSGAPVYATDGRVIAMVTGKIIPYSNMAVAVSSLVLCSLIEGQGKLAGQIVQIGQNGQIG